MRRSSGIDSTRFISDGEAVVCGGVGAVRVKVAGHWGPRVAEREALEGAEAALKLCGDLGH